MAMKTRCRNCNTLIDFGNTYCTKCDVKVREYRKVYKTQHTKEADKLTKTSRWQRLRLEIIRRDNGCCALCFIRGRIEYRNLQVHHLVKRVENPALAYEKSNLITLCKMCHEEVEKLSVEKQRKLLRIEDKQEETFFLL